MSLILDQVALKRNSFLLFENFSFVCAPGEIFEIIGPNGCGKTSLLKMIAGYIPAFSGTITSLFADKPFYIPLQTGMDLALSAYENLEYICALNHQASFPISEVLKKFEIYFCADQPLKSLSSGQRQRVYLATLLLVPRTLWLLDEPLLFLDQEGENIFYEICKNHCQNKGSIIITAPQKIGIGQHVSLIEYYCHKFSSSQEWE